MELAARSDFQFSQLFQMSSPVCPWGAEADMFVGAAHGQLCGCFLFLSLSLVVLLLEDFNFRYWSKLCAGIKHAIKLHDTIHTYTILNLNFNIFAQKKKIEVSADNILTVVRKHTSWHAGLNFCRLWDVCYIDPQSPKSNICICMH